MRRYREMRGLRLFKLLLVDDEALIRKHLRTALDWSAMGIDIIAEAGDGLEAMRKMEECLPDIVLLDVNMPKQSGLELISRVQGLEVKPKIVFLSALKDFEYVQQALHYEAEEYLLKPIDPNKLAEVMDRVKHKLLRERYEREYVYKLKEQVEASLPVVREQFLNSWVQREMSPAVLKEKLDYLGIRLNGSEYRLLLFDIDKMNNPQATEEERQMLKVSVQMLQEGIKAPGTCLYFSYGEQFVIILCSDESDNDTTADYCERLVQAMERVLGLGCTIGVSRPTTRPERLHLSCKEAKEALALQIRNTTDRIFYFQDISFGKESLAAISIDEERIVIAIKQGNADYIFQELNSLFDQIEGSPSITYEFVMSLALRVMSAYTFAVHQSGFTLEEVFPDTSPFIRIIQKKNRSELRQSLYHTANEILCFINQRTALKYNKMVVKAIAYIEQHYTDSDLTLKVVSEQMNMSYTYFSHLFKQVMKENFSDYLNRLRIGKAKELLERGDQKIYEISYALGYSDPHYFSQAFKQIVGKSPSEYKNLNLK